jgi:hypothetical protein
MRARTRPRHIRFLILTGVMLTALVLTASGRAAARGIVCTSGTSFNLQATAGHIVTPDGNSVFMWSFAPDPGGFQSPGPTLCVTAGSTVTVHLRNNLPEAVSVVFPGQSGVTATGDADGLFTKEAAANGGEATYSFVASEPGTYIYQSGSDVTKQVEMGLYGALIVRPAGHPDWAYNDSSTQFDPSREYLLLLHDIDPFLHAAVERGQPFRISTRRDRYFTINGRSFPDTIADNGVSWLATQPYGALVATTPSMPGAKPGLIRYANAGLSNHPMHPHGNHLRVIARDGRLLRGPLGQDTSFEDFTRTIGSGQTYDTLLRWTNAENYSPSNPVPVLLPSYRNLVFKDGRTWYSGSPYLGYKGTLPAGTTSNNQCGEYYFPLHSHALNEFTNFDEGFGGMATLLRVDPPSNVVLSGSPSTRTVGSGASTTYTVNVAGASACGSVVLGVSGLPQGATAGFNPVSVGPNGGTSTLTVQTSASTPEGAYPLTITGSGGAASAVVTLVVGTAPDFSLTAAPPTATVSAGTNAVYTVNVGAVNGFAEIVALSASGLPAGATATFTPASVTGSGTSQLAVTTAGVAAGTYPLTVTGTSLTLSHSAGVTLVVTATPDFGLSATPASASVSPGGSATYTATVSALNGFSGSVSLAASGLPAGAGASFSPNPRVGPGNSTLTVTTTSGTTPPGSYPLTITGTSGALTHSTGVTLVVNAPPPPVTNKVPSSVTVETGSAAGSPIANLQTSNDLYFDVTSALTPSFTRAASWYGVFTAVPAALGSLTVLYEGRNSVTCAQTVSIWNWLSASWTLLDSRSVGNSDVTISGLVPPGPLASYVGTGVNAGQLRVRVRCSLPTFTFSNFLSKGDFMRISYG